MNNHAPVRSDYIRPIIVATSFTFLGELLIFIIWGVSLFPSGDLWKKLAWTSTCGIAMGATIGAFINLFVTERLVSLNAALASGGIYFLVLALCTVLCYQIDMSIGFFGARESPFLFILGGVVPAFVSAFMFVWILYSRTGQAFLTRAGL